MIEAKKLAFLMTAFTLQTYAYGATSKFLESSTSPSDSIITSVDLTEEALPSTAAAIDEDELMTILEAEDTMGDTIVEENKNDFISTVQ